MPLSTKRPEIAASATGPATRAVYKGSTEAPVDIAELTAAQALEQIGAGAFGAGDYTSAMAERAGAAASLNAFIAQRWDEAIAEARAADDRRARGQDVGPLGGLPFVAKDNIDSKQMPTTAGTPGLRDWRPRADAPVLAKALQAGGVLVGKANMHELAFGITSNNAGFGAVGNPYRPDLIPGGSSGGTAAAIAARMVPWGLGSDTGGSCRIPAALCGIVGFRPTLGRYAQSGVVPLSSTRDTVGPLARSVTDIVLLDRICADGSSSGSPVRLEGLRLGVPRAYFYADLDPSLRQVVQDALTALANAGAVLVEADIDGVGEANQAVSFPVVLFEVLRELSAYLYMHGSRMSVVDIVDQVGGSFEKGVLQSLSGEGAIPASVHRDVLAVARPRLQALYADYFRTNDVDALIVPTTPLPARPIGEDETVALGHGRVPTFATYIRNTDPPSNAGLPAISLPAGLTAEGLPVGMELVGPAMSDGHLLSIALAVEAILPAMGAPG